MDDMKFEEALYKVDNDYLVHLKEARDGCHYAVFEVGSKMKAGDGLIPWQDIGDSPIMGSLAAFRLQVFEEMGLEGVKVAAVSVNMLRDFRDSDVRRRGMFEPETLPRKDIRVIDSSYNGQFRIPDGVYLQVTYPDRVFSVKCEHIDDYHAYYGGEIYHICQFAEIVERGDGTMHPEQELDAQQAAWKLGWRNYLAVEATEGGWDYSLFDDKFDLVDGGVLEKPEASIREARNEILAAHKMERRSMTPTDHGLLMDKAAQREQETLAEKRESVLGRLSALKAGAKEQAAPAPAKKRDEVSL